jgi:hypothetical protein
MLPAVMYVTEECRNSLAVPRVELGSRELNLAFLYLLDPAGFSRQQCST